MAEIDCESATTSITSRTTTTTISSSSLQQELNLARRACWCNDDINNNNNNNNNKNGQIKATLTATITTIPITSNSKKIIDRKQQQPKSCENCCITTTAIKEANITTNAITTTATTTKNTNNYNKNDDEDHDDDDDDVVANKTVVNDHNKLVGKQKKQQEMMIEHDDNDNDDYDGYMADDDDYNNTNNDDDDDADDSDDVKIYDDNANDDNDDDLKTVLNGATFRKLLNNTNKINKNNAKYNKLNNLIISDSNKHINNDNINYNNDNDHKFKNATNSKNAKISLLKNPKNSYQKPATKTSTTTTTTSQTTTKIYPYNSTPTKITTTSKLSKKSNKGYADDAKREISQNPQKEREMDAKYERVETLDFQFSIYLKMLLINYWLEFVKFCDSITIKHDDPHFIEQRKREAEQRERKKAAAATGTAGSASKSEPSSSWGQYKLLTNKKLIILFLVCVFFSCVNRIEGRPNMSAIRTAILGATDENIAVGSMAIPPSPSPASLSSSQAPASEATLSDKKYMERTERNIAISVHDEPLHMHDRYPLSQVDFERVKTPFIIGIWILSASIAKIGFHMTPKLHLIFPESCLLIVVGVAIGVVLYFGTEVAVSPLTPNTFFFYMLPPIILDAGYFMPNRLFFDNLGTILLMAVVGTIFNIATIGGSLWACGLTGLYGEEHTPRFLETFLFASLISAVDPVAVLAVFEEIHVNEILYIVVFGESLLNDAVTVVMYHMMEVYNTIGIPNIIAQDVFSGVGSFFLVAIGGTIIGIIWGFLTGLVTRFTDHVRVIEPIFIFVMAYLAYLNAEIFHWSGILSITFCGITMKNYVESNISQKSHTTVKYALKMLSSSSETIIFMFLGVATVNNSHVWNTWFVVLTIIFCSVFRTIGVIILTALANRFRLHKLSRVDQFVMSYGGLRGAVAFALVLLIDERVVKQKDMFMTTTIAVIYFTVFLQGITIKPLVKFLNVKRANKRKPTMNERIHERFMDHLMAGIEDIVGKTGNYNVRDKFKRFDNRFIRPLLIRDLKGAEPKIIETYSKLTMRDAMEVMRRNPSTIGQITATESMSALFRNYTNNGIGGRWAPPAIYTTCPSLTNLDTTCSRNLDMHELDYNPSKKDLTDAKIHHLLAEELKPYRRHRRLSYSRHAVDDRDLSTQVNYKMQMNFRRMFNDRKHHKRSKRGASKQQESVKQNHVSFHDFQQNGQNKQLSNDYINEVLNESAEENLPKFTDVTVTGAADDWDDGLTFTAKSSPDSDRANNNSLIAHIQSLPGFDASKARIVQHYAQKSNSSSPEKILTPDVGPTAAELILPWRRDRSYQSIVPEHPIPEEDRNLSRDSDSERRVATPTATESQLPWKRGGDESSDAVKQNEFPAWASNKEYLAYNSPSATFLGGITKPKQPKSVIGLFRRESSGSKGGGGISDSSDGGTMRGSDPALAAVLSNMVPSTTTTTTVTTTTATMSTPNPRLDKRSQSLAGPPSNMGDGHSGPFPVTASHRRNVRRGSMLELSGDIIPEETLQPYGGHSKSLCEPDDSGDWENALSENEPFHRTASTSSNNDRRLRGSGREPLLPKLTPRAQIRRMGGGGGAGGGSKSQVTTALLSTSNSDYDDDEDEDFDLYDDENIVVTTMTLGAGGRARSGSGGSGIGLSTNAGDAETNAAQPTTTTTTIKLMRKNDESII